MTSNHAEQVRARKTADALACGIDDAFISQLVESFYDTVRQDDMLGPIFAERIGDWPHHLARMKDFWALGDYPEVAKRLQPLESLRMSPYLHARKHPLTNVVAPKTAAHQ